MSGSTSPTPKAARRLAKTQVAAPNAAAPGDDVITFDDFPIGTAITDAYRDRGIVFGSTSGQGDPFIASDGANPTSPVLSGSPLFSGDIAGQFVIKGTNAPTYVQAVTVDVGYIDDPGSVQLLAYTSSGIDVVSADAIGINTLTSSVGNIFAFEIVQSAEEGNGFAIDNVAFTAGTVVATGASGGAPTASESNGQQNPGENLCVCGIRFGGDPINTLTGNATETYRDVSVNEAGPGLNLERTYNSLESDQDGWFGHGWQSSWEASLDVTDTTATATFGNGSQVSFTKTPLGWFAAPRVTATLTSNDDGTSSLVVGRRTTMTFDETGTLTRIQDLNGRTIDVGRPDPSTVVVHDGVGRTLTLHLVDGHVATVTDPTGSDTSYSYSAAGDLTGVVDPVGARTSFAYNNLHQLTTITNPVGAVVTNQYDGQQRVVKQTNALGKDTSFDYTTKPGSTLVTEPDGLVTEQDYDGGLLVSATVGLGRPSAAKTVYQYDPFTTGRIKDVAPGGATTTRTFDADGNVLSVTDPDGRTVSYTYDNFDDPTSITYPSGRVDTADYDGAGNLEATTVDVDGLALTTSFQRNADGAIVQSISPNFEFSDYTVDAAGLTTSMLDPDGRRISFTFDDLGQESARIVEADPDNPGSAGSRITQQTWDFDSRLIKSIDPAGGQTTYTYDGAGRLISTTGPTGHAETSTYDKADNLTASTSGDGSKTTYTFDAAQRMTSRTDPGGATTHYAYDDLGRQVSETDPLGRKTTRAFNAAGQLASRTSADGTKVTYTNDPAGQLMLENYSNTTPDVAFTYDADGARKTMSDGSGTTTYRFDTAGRLVGLANGAGEDVGYERDLDGNVVAITYPNGNEVTRTFSDAGLLTGVTDWLGNTTSIDSDALGQTSSVNYPNGLSGAWTFDASGQPSGVRYTADGGVTPVANFTATVGTGGQVTTLAATGHITETASFGYNDRNQLNSVAGHAVTYDPAGNLQLRPDGATQKFDASGQLTSNSLPTTPAPPASPTGFTAPTILRTTAAHSKSTSATQVRLNSLSVVKGNTVTVLVSAGRKKTTKSVGAAHVSGPSLAFTRAGQRRSAAGRTEVWTATVGTNVSTSRVTVTLGAHHGAVSVGEAVASGVDSTQFTSKKAKNSKAALKLSVRAGSVVLTTVSSTGGTSPSPRPVAGSTSLGKVRDRPRGFTGTASRTGAISTTGTVKVGIRAHALRWNLSSLVLRGKAKAPAGNTYTYTVNGERRDVRSGGLLVSSYTYDAEHRLTTVANAAGSVASYKYDGDGLRSQAKSATGTKTFAYDQSGDLALPLTDGSTSYVYGTGGVPLEQITGATATYLLPDTRGSVRLLANSTGDVVGTASYSVTGAPTGQSGSKSALGFDGQYTDANTGLQYLRARYYDPKTAAFLTADPLRGLTASSYGFAGGNPVSFADPSGLFFVSCSEILSGEGDLLGGAGDLSEGLARRASTLGKILRSSSSPAARSYAASLLRGAGELSNNPVFKTLRVAGRALPVIGGILTTVGDLSDGKSVGESVGAGVGAGVGGVAGGALGSAACGAETVATFGLGAVACPVLIIGGGYVGGKIGEFIGGGVGGWLGRHVF